MTSRRALARVFAAFAELNELQEDVARERHALRVAVGQAIDDLVGVGDDRPLDAPDRLIRRLAQHPVLAPQIELRQTELEQRQVAGLVTDVVEQPADEPRLEAQPGDLRRTPDRLLSLGASHPAEQDRRLLQALAQRPVCDRPAGEVGAQRQHDAQRHAPDCGEQAVGKRRGGRR